MIIWGDFMLFSYKSLGRKWSAVRNGRISVTKVTMNAFIHWVVLISVFFLGTIWISSKLGNFLKKEFFNGVIIFMYSLWNYVKGKKR